MSDKVGIIITYLNDVKKGDEQKITDLFKALVSQLDKFDIQNTKTLAEIGVMYADVPQGQLDDVLSEMNNGEFSARKENQMHPYTP